MLKFYNHLPTGQLVAEKTEERERLEEIWCEENQDYLLER